MFESTRVEYVLYEGNDQNDNEESARFRSKQKALTAFKKSKTPYAAVHAYKVDELDSQDYTDTLAERGMKGPEYQSETR